MAKQSDRTRASQREGLFLPSHSPRSAARQWLVGLLLAALLVLAAAGVIVAFFEGVVPPGANQYSDVVVSCHPPVARLWGAKPNGGSASDVCARVETRHLHTAEAATAVAAAATLVLLVLWRSSPPFLPVRNSSTSSARVSVSAKSVSYG